MAGIIESGIVAAVGENGVDVRIDVAGSDIGCAHCGHCTAAAGGMVMCDVADPVGVRAGDTVQVELPQGARFLSSAVAYGLPVLALVAGYLAGFLLGRTVGWDADAVGAVTAIGLAAGTFLMARRIGSAAIATERFRPRVRAIIAPSEGGHDSSRRSGGSDG